MTNNVFHSGILKNNQEIYKQAMVGEFWVCYNKQWFTPLEFIQNLGEREINIAHITLGTPIDILNQGRMVIENMIIIGTPKDKVLDAFQRLNKFTDKVRMYHSSTTNSL